MPPVARADHSDKIGVEAIETAPARIDSPRDGLAGILRHHLGGL
jgi:hypothetical protein